MPHQAFLEELGARLRGSRDRLGLTVAEAARRAEVSRRYLTDAEAGRANPSALVLVRLARALETTVARLFEGAERGASVATRERIALVGLRGAGKSTVGRKLALALEVPFVELDTRVEDAAGLVLAEIFALHGEEGFHRFETEALERVLAEGQHLVLATGGSIVDDAANFERLCATCRTVWLRATPEEHYVRVLEQGDARPMRNRPRAMEELRAILAAREALYGRCDEVVDTSGRTVDEVVAELAERLRDE